MGGRARGRGEARERAPRGRYYTQPHGQEKGTLSLAGVTASDIKTGGFVEIGKYSLTIRTPKREWQLSAETDSACKAWMKNLVTVIGTSAKAKGLSSK